MDITLQPITIRELVNGFSNNEEEGVVGYGGLLNIRPKYQREFVYSENQQIEVINSIFKGFPLNVMYWCKNADGTFEMLDGQQRTLSICAFYVGNLFVNVEGTLKAFHNLTPSQKDTFLNTTLQIYICENGTDTEKLDWFRIINIAGEKLTNQELLNAVYAGPWVTSLKKRFAKTNCVAQQMASDYLSGSPIRQAYVEIVLKWISKNDVEHYMALHQQDTDSDIEWQYFQDVIHWVQKLFPVKRVKLMKGLPWGTYYNTYKDLVLKSSELEERIKALVDDDEVENKKGIYEYLLSGDERCLGLRAFSPKIAQKVYEKQQGFCAKCGQHFEISAMEADHIVPWSKGGLTVEENCQMLCRHCNRTKSAS